MVKLDKVKWGFIGCGEVTEKKSGPAFALIEGSEVVAVMSRDKEKAQSYAKRHNIPRWYSDPQQLIGDEDVNAIYIATPPSSHATFAIMSMKAGKPVYIEKLLAASFSMQGDGIVSENRETDHSLVSDDFYTVFLGRFMGNETP
jgi:1,5-anhydro-D-fructose reductase (1,5-anhydro-D-mannitol-forming)